ETPTKTAVAAPETSDTAHKARKPTQTKATPSSSAPAVPRLADHKAKPAAKKNRLPVSQRKLFVLDTNVLLHDSNSLFKFEEHDIFLPMIVLEELDHQKKGMSEVSRNARQVSRSLDGLVNAGADLTKGMALDTLGNVEA